MTKPKAKTTTSVKPTSSTSTKKKVEGKKPEAKKAKDKPVLVSKLNTKPTAASGDRFKSASDKPKPIVKEKTMTTEPAEEKKVIEAKTETSTSKTAYLPAGETGQKKEKKVRTPRDPNAPRITGKSKEYLPKIITVLTDKNPRRAGSETFKIFEFYNTGDTVAEFIKKGGRLIDVKADVARKHIALADPKA